MCAMSGHRWCCTIPNTRRRCRWNRKCRAELRVIPGRALARTRNLEIPGLRQEAHPGMTKFVQAGASTLLAHHRVETPRPAAGTGEEQAGKTQHDREIAAVQQRNKASREMPDEIGECHFTAQDLSLIHISEPTRL